MHTPADTFKAATGSAWFLTANQLETIQQYLSEQGLLEAEEAVTEVASAGEGNMNVTLKVTTSQRTIVLKQSRPWVARFPDIPAPIGRIGVEYAYLQATAKVAGLASRQPKVLHYDAENFAMVLEYLDGAKDMSYLYRAI
ncbi:MAG: hypothetical protein AAF597_07655, partial [Bacteroidota bacterium]